jgi:hypothetical protein
MSRNLIYCWPSDDLLYTAIQAGLVTLVDGTLDSAYTLADLVSGNPGRGCVFTTTHFAITIDHGSAVTLQLLAVIHSNLRSNASCTIQRNATNSWGAPSLSYTLTLTDADADGLRPNPWADRRNDAAYRWTKIIMTGNAVSVIIGQLLLSQTLRQLKHNITVSPDFTPTFKTIVNATNAGVKLKTQKGVRVKMLTGQSGVQLISSLPDLLVWFYASAGQLSNSLLIPDPTVNDAWYAEWANDAVAKYTPVDPDGNANIAPAWTEISRAQKWT